MKITIVTGSHRTQSQSKKVGNFIASKLEKELRISEVNLIDLGNQHIPEWNEGKWQNTDEWQQAWKGVSIALRESDALVAVAPEWGGMVPPKLKNFFLLCDNHELAHKPGLIVAVSASRGGAYPVVELRMGSYKNTHLVWIPDHVIVRNVETVLNDPQSVQSDDDKHIQDRLLYSLNVLCVYAESMKSIRTSDVIDLKRYSYGM
jgi:NAD(P)H-dependent FMN reductase